MRATVLVLASLAAVGLSGCHEILRVTLGGSDPPVHRAPPAGRAASEPPGRAFSGRAVGKLASKVTLRHGFVKSTMKNVRFTGDFTAKPTGASAPGDENLGPLANATWHGSFNAVRNRANGKISLSGLVLATFTDPAAGRACLRIAYKNARSRKRGTSTVKILGGQGGASTLVGSATVRVRVGTTDTIRLNGRVRASRGRARGFPSACAKLEQAFGLQPVG